MSATARSARVAAAVPHDVLDPLVTAFDGEQLFLVGGFVRDLLDPNVEARKDIDLTTSATIDASVERASTVGTVIPTGIDHGTVTVLVNGFEDDPIEITTFRTETYLPDSRKPVVAAAASLDEDLRRRDFTVNAIAFDLHAQQLTDPFGGIEHLTQRRLVTPGDADTAFSDDPLRIARAVRFAVTRQMRLDHEVVEAARRQAHRCDIVAVERYATELVKTLSSPRIGALHEAAKLAVQLGVAEQLFAGLPVDRLPADGASAANLEARLAMLAIAAGRDPAKALRALKLGNDLIVPAVKAAETANMARHRLHYEVASAVRKHPDAVLDAAAGALDSIDTDSAAVLAAERRHSDVLRAKLPVDGNDMLELGLSGPAVGAALRRVEDYLLSFKQLPSREHALMLAAM